MQTSLLKLNIRIEAKPGVLWDPMPKLTITSPYVYSRVDSNTFTMGGYTRVDFHPIPESTLFRDFEFCLSQCKYPVQSSLHKANVGKADLVQIIPGQNNLIGQESLINLLYLYYVQMYSYLFGNLQHACIDSLSL